MDIQEQINNHISGVSEPKRSEMELLHKLVLQVSPDCKLWFEDGIDDQGKIVANPSIGYGSYTIQYTNGKTKEFYRVGISANTTGISVYILDIKDKTLLSKRYGQRIGKASITGYCIKFKTVKDIHTDVLEEAIRYGIEL